MILLLIGFAIVGLLASGILFAHQRLLTFLAAGGILAEAFWLLLTFIDRAWLFNWPAERIYIVGLLLILAALVPFIKQFKFPYAVASGSGLRDAYILLPLVLTLVSAFWVMEVNGFKPDFTYVTYGFMNGDGATLTALVQKSFATPQLVTQNPFSGNGFLEYPTLWHGALASFFETLGFTSGDGWLTFLPTLVYAQIFLTVPMFFLLWDLAWPQPPRQERWLGVLSHHGILWLQSLLVLFIMGLSWDAYIYPQTHFFLVGLFLLTVSLLVVSLGKRGKEQIWPAALATVLAYLLLRSNSVVGTAAMVVAAMYWLSRALSKKEMVRTRAIALGLTVLLGVIFLLTSGGGGNFGIKPHFPYSAVGDTMLLATGAGLLFIGIALGFSRQQFLSLAAVALAGLTVVTFVFSQRHIVTANASRFLYLGLLVGLPLLLQPLVAGYMWWRRELFYSTRSLLEWLIGLSVSAGVIIILFLMPAGGGVVSALSHLVASDKQTVTTPMRVALWYIQDKTKPTDIILASPYEPWSVPYFTGRSLLRTSYADGGAYWLSADDATLGDMRAAFDTGDKAAQKRLESQADYLLLTSDNRKLWEPLPFPKVLNTDAVVIYKLK